MLLPEMTFIPMLFLMIMAHGLADFPLQGQYLSDAKNPNHALGKQGWPLMLFLHACIHGGFVFLITGSLILGGYEVIIHCVIDYLKCRNRITFMQDQCLHLFCKVAWAFLAMMVPQLA